MTKQDETPSRDATMRIEVEHTRFYQQVPIPEDQVFDDTPVVVTAEDGTVTTLTPEVPEGMVGLSDTTASTFPGYRMYKATITSDTPVLTTTDVHLPDLEVMKADRIAAGLDARTHRANLIQHLQDGPWVKHFPLSSITAIRCTDKRWQKYLTEHFVNGDGDDYLGGA